MKNNHSFKYCFFLALLLLSGSASSIISEKKSIVLSDQDRFDLQKVSCNVSANAPIDFVEARAILPLETNKNTIDAIVSCMPNQKLRNFDVRRKSVCNNSAGEWSCYNGYLDVYAEISGKKVVVSAEDTILEVSLDAINYLSKANKLNNCFAKNDNLFNVSSTKKGVLDVQ